MVEDIAFMAGSKIKLEITKTGHYCIDLDGQEMLLVLDWLDLCFN